MQLYYLYALGAANAERKIIIKEDLEKIITVARKSNQMLFHSYYLYDEEALEHLKIRKTIKGYRGNFYLDNLVFDLDDHDNKFDFGTYKQYIISFVNNLTENWRCEEESIRIWFSGRGYHVETPDFFGFNSTNLLPVEVKSTVEKHFPNVDTMPMSSNGMIRGAFTINEKSKLFKVPFEYGEYRRINEEELLRKAQIGKAYRPPLLTQYSDMHYEDIINIKPRRKTEGSIDNTNSIVTCVQKMYDMNNQTHRHKRILIMASTFKRSGIPRSGVDLMMKEWMKKQTGDKEMTEYEVERIVSDVYNASYQFGCDNKYLKELCDPKCMFYKRKNYTVKVATSTQMDEELKVLVNSDYAARGFDLNEIFYVGHKFMIYPKELVVVFGDTKIGKSALVQNWMVKLDKLQVLYLTLEVPRLLMHRRNLQIQYNMTKEQVNRHYASNKPKLGAELSHINIVDAPTQLSHLKKLVLDSQSDVIVIDTVNRIKLDDKYYGDPLIPITEALMELGKELGVIIIVVHHIGKSAAVDQKGNSKKLTIHSGLGTSVLEQLADKVIGFEDLGNGMRLISSLGARDETPFVTKRIMNPDNFRMIRL